ncbi:MAG: DNA gyrase subunit A [Planctomycetaceae bacterium]|nr:DNA gyrase subunit A [Planctomycetaceae bacterium]
MSNVPPDDFDPNDPSSLPTSDDGGGGERMIEEPIEDELRDSYLTYAMSVIVSRALPDVRDGLKPSQRRILVAMNDLNLTPGAARVKCAKIAGDTSGNYHPHGEAIIYPTLVRMAQEWNMRHVLIDKQGNFGSIAGLPAAAMRYTEARLAGPAAMMLEDLKLDTVDFIPTYDERRTEPVVLPSRFPNLLVNGAQGIAVGMATSIPPHNLREICNALVKVIDDPEVSVAELCDIVPGPDFPTGGIICGRYNIRQAYMTGRSTIVVRAHVDVVEEGRKSKLIVRDIPFQQARDRVVEKIAELVRNEKIKGISGIRDESDLKEPVRLVIEIKQNADPNVVLNQLFQFSPLQETFSIILLALVDGKPRELNIKELLQEFIRHRFTVIRRRTQHLLGAARKRKHVIEGLLLALADIDRIIAIIRSSRTQAEAKEKLMGVECPASMMQRALGERGYADFQLERGVSDTYKLTSVQTDSILRMTLGQLAGLEQEKLGQEHSAILQEIEGYREILASPAKIYSMIREDLVEIARKYGNDRVTEISDEELGNYNMEDLITEESMVVTISHQGYIKRLPASVYKSQKRGGKGITGLKAEEEDPVEHLFVASTHAYLLFFTNQGKVYWQKVWEIPQMSRESKGRAIVNLLNLTPEEKIRDCVPVRDFNLPGHFLMMATKKGIVKKTPLEAYSRPKKGGIIAIKLREDDELVDVVVTKPKDQIVLSTAGGMAIRFSENNARSMGRNTSGVKGISLKKADEVVGMVVADPTATLLTVCLNGYGKRTNFGPGDELVIKDEDATLDDDSIDQTVAEQSPTQDESSADESPEDNAAEDNASSAKYRTQRRGGKGIIDIKTSKRNGPVVGTVAVYDNDELIMMTSRGKIQRIAANDISVIGRNTQGVRIMSLDESDTLAAIVRVPAADIEAEAARVEAEAREQAAKAPPSTPTSTSDQQSSNAEEDSEDSSEE